jgi:ABC-2 type transport system permease protein
VNKTVILFKREYLTRVMTKGFIIGTLLMPLFILCIAFMPYLMSKANIEKMRQVSVIDLSGKVYDSLVESLGDTQAQRQSNLVQFQKISTGNSLDDIKKNLDPEVLSAKIDAYIVIPKDVFTSNNFELYLKNTGNFAFNQKIERLISNVIINRRMQDSALDPELLKKINHWVGATTFKIAEKGSKQESSQAAFFASYVMVFLLYFALVLYGTFVMRGVIEDKNSRVIEVVMSSVKSNQFMAGKILGIGAAGLTQFLVWVISAILVSSFGLTFMKQMNPAVSGISFPSISVWVYVAFLTFFFLGYFLYATLYAAIGSMVDNESDAQSIQWPVVMFLILSFMLMFLIINNPDGTAAVVLSLIPLCAPILMLFRITVSAVPLYQVLISIVLLLLTIWGLIWVAGRIFRVGILMHGKRPTLPEVTKWIKYSS